ncbi:Gfo/Idh/MocA family oxidoreductase [Clostridium sp. KNHs205]|jgi:scyllo-inositol 2-dehydrogenase (NADP+)|uniref:Gfo/Idh/MocA family protein n=1 Tax=Clostridium sp. KNHs205 TaxID=1449050 RepID=UPI00051BDFC4|nr:Gfo/Idh/MocA family oxidoreductase [Clostridium sp. KNHs205]
MLQEDMKIAIVGLGGMGDWHRELIESIDGLTLAGIYDIKEERQEYAKEKKIRVYASFEELLADEEVELCLIATPNDLHKPLAIAAMKAGKHVVSEKPVTLNSEDLKEMIAASEETGKLFTVHQNRRWDEDFLTMKKIYNDNLLGEVFRIESRVHGSRGIPGDWRQLKEQGGGMVLDWGVHLLDQILLMLKGVKLNKVYATITHVTNQLVDDGFTTSLLFENGVEVIIEVGTSNFVNLPRWYMLGANGTAIIEDWSLKGEIVSAKGQNEKDVVPVKTAAGLTKTMAPRREDTIAKTELPVVKSDIRDFYRNVIKAIRGEEEINIKLPEVARVMRLMEAIFESAEKQQVVDFE